jgi:hypothetical protein
VCREQAPGPEGTEEQSQRTVSPPPQGTARSRHRDQHEIAAAGILCSLVKGSGQHGAQDGSQAGASMVLVGQQDPGEAAGVTPGGENRQHGSGVLSLPAPVRFGRREQLGCVVGVVGTPPAVPHHAPAAAAQGRVGRTAHHARRRQQGRGQLVPSGARGSRPRVLSKPVRGRCRPGNRKTQPAHEASVPRLPHRAPVRLPAAGKRRPGRRLPPPVQEQC